MIARESYVLFFKIFIDILKANQNLPGHQSTSIEFKFLSTNKFCTTKFFCYFLTYRKIYNEFVDERLKELKNLTLKSKQQYEDLFKEIDQLVKMDTNNFQQLTELWINLKK